MVSLVGDRETALGAGLVLTELMQTTLVPSESVAVHNSCIEVVAEVLAVEGELLEGEGRMSAMKEEGRLAEVLLAHRDRNLGEWLCLLRGVPFSRRGDLLLLL